MFENLGKRLQQTSKRLRGQARLTEQNMSESLREVRMALLEADVALPVVKDFIEQVRERSLGQDVIGSLTPGQALVKVVHDELITLMGESNDALNLATRPPAVILVAGLQGAGKTTSVAKLAHLLMSKENKSVMVASADIYRPAAIEQLKRLAADVGVAFFDSATDQKPVDIAHNAVDEAKKKLIDVIIIDTAGRMHIDKQMMSEIQAIHHAIDPIETLFVVDSTTGQDAVNTAKAFDETLPLTGVILTKTDGDARGGAALSIRHITGKPIKFLGIGEKSDALEPFHPDRIASRILGMGDVLSLVETVQEKTDQEEAAKLVKKIKKGKGFDLEDFRSQLLQMEQMGGLSNLIDKLPGMSGMAAAAKERVNDKEMGRTVAIINSMTVQERKFPNIIKGSRKRRIATGSGSQVQDVNRMLKQFLQMQKMMKRMGKGGISKLMKGGKGLPGLPF